MVSLGKNISKALPVLPINLNMVAETSNTLLGKDITFNEYAVRWINASTLQPSTERSYRNHIKKLSLVFGDMVITQIVPIMIKEYKKTIEHYSPKYQKNILTTFSIIMESAKNDRLIDENPLKFVSKPKVTLMKAYPFFIKDVKKIIQYMEQTSPHMTAFFAIGFFMGLRTGEIMGLKWSDVDFSNNILRVQRTITDGKIKEGTKTTPYRDIPIPLLAMKYINRHKQYTLLKSEWMFISNQNTPFMSYSTINNYYWKKVLLACGLRYREPYQMRHSFACNALNAGFEVSYIQHMLGHSSLEMVFKVYGNFIPKNNLKNGFNDVNFLEKIS